MSHLKYKVINGKIGKIESDPGGVELLSPHYLLLLPGGVELLPLGEYRRRLLLDLGGGAVVLAHHGFPKGHNLTKQKKVISYY